MSKHRGGTGAGSERWGPDDDELVAKSCLTLATPWTVAHSSVHGILQARILEWVAICARGRPKPRGRGRDKSRTPGCGQARRAEQGLVRVPKARREQGWAGDDVQTTDGCRSRKRRARTSRPRNSRSPSSSRRSVRAVEPRVRPAVDCTYRSTASAKLNLSGA